MTYRRRVAQRLLGPTYYRRFPAWHRAVVGGAWNEMGRVQLEFLEREGLRPDHHLLDIGCGCLRAGVHFVGYLEPGHYCGIDGSTKLLTAGRVELERNGLEGRGARLLANGMFEFDRFGQQFDFAIAQSLFTHVPINTIMRCLLNIEAVLADGGRFYATYFENPDGTRNLREIPRTAAADIPPFRTFADHDPYHYGVDMFEWLCEPTSLRVERIGEWGSLREQMALRFTRKASR
jgi:cyclopropane fatty-acyl-phospholipid synthase-like methyltransferase